MNRKIFVFTVIAVLLSAMAAGAVDPTPVQPGEKDKCPVCGMFVHKWPDWVGQISFSDGSRFFFDGAKDLFKFYFDLEKYNPGKTKSDVAAMWVTEYYQVVPIRVEKAFFVVGGDIPGPMGNELIPFDGEAAAREFMSDHHGADVLTFDRITPSVIDGLE